MDFSQKGTQPNQNVGGSASAHHVSSKRRRRPTGVLGWISVLLLVSVTILLVTLLVSIVTGAPKNETKYVNSKSLQAVFLNNGQVYFGKISALNDKYVRLGNIYYLRVNQAVQPKQSSPSTTNSNDVSLVKLGCELHGPEDQMLINRDQVTFWENLKTDGQVAKAVADYIKNNPDGQKCSTANNNSSNSNSNPSNSNQ